MSKFSRTTTRVDAVPSREATARLFAGGTVDADNLRTLPSSTSRELFNRPEPVEGIYETVKACYANRLEDYRRGNWKPLPMRTFEGASHTFSRLLEERIPINHAKFLEKPAEVACAVIPWFFKVPHPTPAQLETFNALWDNDGSLQMTAKRLAPDCEFIPFVVEGPTPKSFVMLCVVMFRFPPNCFKEEGEDPK